MLRTCGTVFSATSTEIDPSGRHRKRGAGNAGVKIRCVSANCLGDPPAAGITNNAGSCALRATDGVETVYAIASPAGAISTSLIVRSDIKSSIVTLRGD